jgi:uncharacterized tellurite resistance protein B-like protein
MNINELYLKTSFCCMACDGHIAEEEVSLLKDMANKEGLFSGINIQESINGYVTSINSQGSAFLNDYIEEVRNANLNDEQALQLIRIAIDTIEADNQIEYSEISFFKRVRRMLEISDETILASMPDKEDYLLPDINDDNSWDWASSFDSNVFEGIVNISQGPNL